MCFITKLPSLGNSGTIAMDSLRLPGSRMLPLRSEKKMVVVLPCSRAWASKDIRRAKLLGRVRVAERQIDQAGYRAADGQTRCPPLFGSRIQELMSPHDCQ